MKTVAVEEVTLRECVKAAQTDNVVIVRDGTPIALMFGIHGYDLEDMELCLSREFWQMIRERRQQPTIPWEEAKRRLEEHD
jgi:hypothetical protein